MSLSSLVSYFFITYTLFSFPSSLFINRFSLRSGVILGASLQALGTYLRYYDRSDPDSGGWLCWLRVGQIIAESRPSLLCQSATDDGSTVVWK